MDKQVILVTGTPAVGKTTLAKKLAEKLNSKYVNLTRLAEEENLALSKDNQRDTIIIDEKKMRRKLKEIITKSQVDVIIDGHYAAVVTPKAFVNKIFVLRRHPAELRRFMEKAGFSSSKQEENLTSEILDVCLVEALQKQEKTKVCELDTTSKTLEETLKQILAVIEGKSKCYFGYVDWIKVLEQEGTLSQYLKPDSLINES